jgi:hypothetical protein
MSVGLLAVLAAIQAMPQSSTTSVPDLNIGDLVRLETRAIAGRLVTGELRAANQGFVAVAVAETGTGISVPWTRVTSLDRFSHRDTPTGVAAGAILGGAAAFVVGASLVSVVALPATGVAIGWANAPRRWSEVTWRPTMDTVMMEGEATRLSLPEGTEIIVQTGRQAIRGHAIRASEDSLIFRRSDHRISVAWPTVGELRVRSGRNRIKGSAIGFLLGGAVGGAVFRAREGSDLAGRTMEPVGYGALIGSALGYLVGVPGWTRIPFPSQ